MGLTHLGASVVIVAMVSAGASCASGIRIGDQIREQIKAALVEQGYEMRKAEREHGMIEVYAVKGGKRFIIYLNDQAAIVRIEEK